MRSDAIIHQPLVNTSFLLTTHSRAVATELLWATCHAEDVVSRDRLLNVVLRAAIIIVLTLLVQKPAMPHDSQQPPTNLVLSNATLSSLQLDWTAPATGYHGSYLDVATHPSFSKDVATYKLRD